MYILSSIVWLKSVLFNLFVCFWFIFNFLIFVCSCVIFYKGLYCNLLLRATTLVTCSPLPFMRNMWTEITASDLLLHFCAIREPGSSKWRLKERNWRDGRSMAAARLIPLRDASERQPRTRVLNVQVCFYVVVFTLRCTAVVRGAGMRTRLQCLLNYSAVFQYSMWAFCKKLFIRPLSAWSPFLRDFF